MPMNETIVASVIIPSFNSSKSICNCVRSVLLQEVKFEFEIVVVDSSEDDTVAVLRERFPQVKIIRSAKRLYPGEARNLGVKSASGVIIAFIDADCIACDKWLETIYQRHESGYIAIGGAIANGNPESTLGWAEYFLEFTEFLPSSPVRELRTIPTCNISYKKDEAFGRYGFFPAMRTAEDTTFNWMLVKNEERILFDPSIKIAHTCNRRLWAFLRNQEILGAGFSESRSRTKMPGSAAVKYLWPILPLVRLFLITKRVMIWDRQMLFKLIQSLPFVVIGLLTWHYGVLHSHFFARRSTGRWM
jgi:glycosyltransferase involved in cell wall biosynthesis